jgi:hypothetical protein
MADSSKPIYLVQRFDNGRWHDTLTTADKAKAEELLKVLGDKGRIDTFKPRPTKRRRLGCRRLDLLWLVGGRPEPASGILVTPWRPSASRWHVAQVDPSLMMYCPPRRVGYWGLTRRPASLSVSLSLRMAGRTFLWRTGLSASRKDMSKILLLAAFGAVVFIGLTTAALVVAPSATRYLERRERIQECMDPYRIIRSLPDSGSKRSCDGSAR